MASEKEAKEADMTTETPNLQAVEQRLEKLEVRVKRNRRTTIAWFLGGTVLLFIFIYSLAEMGSGLLENRDRLENMEKQRGQSSQQG